MKIICWIFSNFLNQCQVHIYRKADAFHKTAEEEGAGGRGAAAVLLLHLEVNLKFKPSLPASKQGLDPVCPSTCESTFMS